MTYVILNELTVKTVLSVNTPIQNFIESGQWGLHLIIGPGRRRWHWLRAPALAPAPTWWQVTPVKERTDGQRYIYRHMLDIANICKQFLSRLTIVNFLPPLQWGERTLSILIALTNKKRWRKEKLWKCLIFIFVCWFSLSQFWS